MGKCIMWIHKKSWYNHNKTKHIKIECIFHGIYCLSKEAAIYVGKQAEIIIMQLILLCFAETKASTGDHLRKWHGQLQER